MRMKQQILIRNMDFEFNSTKYVSIVTAGFASVAFAIVPLKWGRGNMEMTRIQYPYRHTHTHTYACWMESVIHTHSLPMYHHPHQRYGIFHFIYWVSMLLG